MNPGRCDNDEELDRIKNSLVFSEKEECFNKLMLQVCELACMSDSNSNYISALCGTRGQMLKSVECWMKHAEYHNFSCSACACAYWYEVSRANFIDSRVKTT